MPKKSENDPIKGKALGKTKMEAPSGRIKGQERLAVSRAVEKSKKKEIDENKKRQNKKEKSARAFAAGVVGASVLGMNKVIRNIGPPKK